MCDHLSPNDEIASIHAELRQLDDAARAITDKRVPLLRRLNTLQSKTSVLPLETLSLIFQHVIAAHRNSDDDEPIDKPLCPAFLGSISHTWRQVSWSSPQLWTTLSHVITTDKVERSAMLLDLYLTNVRDLPITVHIAFDYNRKYLLDYENDSAAQVLFKAENLVKLLGLQVRNPPTSWISHFDRRFLHLAAIRLEDGDRSLVKNTAFLLDAPALRKISLRYIDPPLIALWSQLTILNLEFVPATLALRCLTQSPGLTEFYYHEFIPNSTSPEEHEGEGEELPEISSTLTLHHLKTLRWSFKLNRASDLFLHRVRLPVLRSLIWDQRQRPLTGNFSLGIWRFFSNLSAAPLTTLCIRRMFNANVTLIKHIYHQNPRVENLQLEYCDEETLRNVLGSLIPTRSGGEQTGGQQCLTKLKTVYVRACASEEDFIFVEILKGSFGDIVADLVIGRTGAESAPGLTINFAFNQETEIDWKPETKERLREFTRTGAQVRLFLDGEQLDWL